MASLARSISKDEAKEYVERFEAEFAKCIRCFKPAKFLNAVGVAYRQAAANARFDDVELMATLPPHLLLWAAEANCAYYRQHNFRPLDKRAFVDAVQRLHGFEDPYLHHVLPPDSTLFAFGQFMYRTQLQWQQNLSIHRVGRAVRLFYGGGSRRMDRQFEEAYGLKPKEWGVLAFGLSSAVMKRVGFDGEYLARFAGVVGSGAASAFLGQVSATPGEIGANYLDQRKDIPTHLWSQLQSTLAAKPIVEIDGSWIVPFPTLLYATLSEGFRCRALEVADDTARKELSDRLEEYVQGLLGLVDGAHLVRQPDKEVRSHQACDFALMLPDAILLVECKAVSYDQTFVTEQAFLRSNSVAKVAEGYKQLEATAARTGGAESRPIYGLVATLGRIYGINKAVARARIEGLIGQPIGNQWLPPDRIQTVDVAGLDYVVELLRSRAMTLPEVWKLKAPPPDVAAGDWNEVLGKKLRRMPKLDLDRSYWSVPFDNLLRDFGLEEPVQQDGG